MIVVLSMSSIPGQDEWMESIFDVKSAPLIVFMEKIYLLISILIFKISIQSMLSYRTPSTCSFYFLFDIINNMKIDHYSGE